MMRTLAFLLDFDGLICDTERAAHRSWQMLYGQHGLDFPREVWTSMLGRPHGESYAAQDLARRMGRDPSAEELLERRRVKACLANAEPLRPGVQQLLVNAAQRGVRCAIVSSSDPDWVFGHLERLAVRKYFELVVTGDRVEAAKPAPLLHMRVLELLSLSPRDSLAFEDSAIGVTAAKAADLFCIAVPGACGDRRSLGGADVVLDSMEKFTFPENSGDAVPA